MCTITIARNVFKFSPIVVVANRDELLDRPSESPQILNSPHSSSQVLAPKDLQRGGSWIGVNNSGLFVGLTNRLNVKSKKGCSSRGKIVDDMLQCKTANEAYKLALKLDGSKYNGFHLIVADKDFAAVICGNNKTLDHVDAIYNGFFVITNHGLGDRIVFETPRRVSSVLNCWEQEQLANKDPIPTNLTKLLDIHDDFRQGTCIYDPADNYGSISSSVIRLDIHAKESKWRYWHRERLGSTHICQNPFNPEIQLPLLGQES